MVPYLRAANVKDGAIVLDDVLEMNFDASEQDFYGLEYGDVLVTEGCGSIGELGASARWEQQHEGVVCFQNTLLRLRALRGTTTPEFLDHWARWAHRTGVWASVASGTNIFHIGLQRARALPIEVPPIGEQARIADLLTCLEAVVEKTTTASTAATALADGIRAIHFKAALADGPRPLEELVEVTNGRQRSPKHASGDHMLRYVRAANVKDGRLLLDEPMYMNFTPKEQERYRLEPGDVLVTEGCGSLGQIGASCQWQGELPGTVCFQNHLLRLRSRDLEQVLQSYVYEWALWCFRAGVFADVATGTNIFSLGTKRVSALPFPRTIPDVQAELVLTLAVLHDYAAAAERNIASLRATRDLVAAELLSGSHRLPDSYEALLERAS